MDISIQFKKGALELCVLVLIHQQARYGYELAQSVSEYIEVAEGALYPLLRRLVKEGYCMTYLQESSGGPPRKYYKLTPEGEVHMHRLVAEWNKFSIGVTRLIQKGIQP
ncbi:PadR family transcriptional regulator [Paenibacillus caui]|uniref:PadR family transcriptional regulator n=1 Tax=Paenibacillus caui TaxID=2873927 RepID=UPI001CA99991|nr:PadR family transcriptional regulator [Paenibacillus caui]